METNRKKEDIREEHVETDFELSIGMPWHLMNHEEFEGNYPGEERGEMEYILNTMKYRIISRQESSIYPGGDTDGNGSKIVVSQIMMEKYIGLPVQGGNAKRGTCTQSCCGCGEENFRS